jgi:hypothetical protein
LAAYSGQAHHALFQCIRSAVFAVTAVLYTMSSQRHFTRVTAQLIRSQVIQMEGNSMPDFILHRVGGPMPGLSDLTRMLANFSASFYSVSDIDLYVHSTENGKWYQLYFDESGTLRKRESTDTSLAKMKILDPSKSVFTMAGHFRTEAAGELIERVKSSVFSFIDVAPRYDDVTMLAVQRTGGGLAA